MQNQDASQSNNIKGPRVNIDAETHKLTISVASDIIDEYKKDSVFNTTESVKIYPI